MFNRLRLAALTLVFFLAGCGGGGGTDTAPAPSPAPPPASGKAIIGLTDAPGDFLSYRVAVTGIRFTSASGAVIETLAESTTIDFADYVEATEMVTAASLPTGTYTAVTLALDYANSKIQVEDGAGGAVEAIVVDENGDPLAATQVTVEFADRDRFVIAPGVPAHVTLDFDLAASHIVDTTVSPPTAAFKGVMVADTLLEDPKTRRVRGLLRSVNTDTSTVSLAVRPFFQPRGDFGAIDIATDAETAFEIDEIDYTGDEGLRALASLSPGASVVVFGEMDRATREVTATILLAGSSVPYGDADIATGSVVARDATSLTLRGVTVVRDDMSVTFNDTLQVSISSNTKLRQQGASLLTLTPADISIGQVVTVHGAMAGDVLDAADGLVRVLYANVAGSIVAVSPLQLDLTSINGRRPGLFDFTGTGVDAMTDADPDQYEIDTGSLPLEGLEIGDPVRVRGLVAAFGTAPSDFVARSVGDVSEVPGRIHVRWSPPGVTDAVLALDAEGITLALDEQALTGIHYLNQAGVFRDLLTLGDQFTLRPRPSDRGVFALHSSGRLTVYYSFASFSEAVALTLDGSTALRSVRASVTVDDNQDYVARRLLMTIE